MFNNLHSPTYSAVAKVGEWRQGLENPVVSLGKKNTTMVFSASGGNAASSSLKRHATNKAATYRAKPVGEQNERKRATLPSVLRETGTLGEVPCDQGTRKESARNQLVPEIPQGQNTPVE